jgi:FtsZ-interacting cell division protein ZipA
MSEFQTGLVVIGVLVIIGVFAYNKWLEHRARGEADQSFRSNHADVLIDGGTSGAAAADASLSEQRIEPGMAARAPSRGAREGEGPMVPVPHSRIDYVIEMVGQEMVSAASLHEAWVAMEHRFPRRTRLAGSSDGQWVLLRADGYYENYQAALQLVSRKGVVGEAELLEFRSGVESIAAKLHLTAAAPEMREALEGARALDNICADADIQVAFHVVAAPGATFPGTKLRAAAEASGFVLRHDGRFTVEDEDGRELYALSDRSGMLFSPGTMKDATPEALTLSMDVPRAPETQRTFDSMVRFGKQLATLLGGSLVDDNNQPLDERSVSTINLQLAAVRRSLEEQGIAPGSALALRLFS